MELMKIRSYANDVVSALDTCIKLKTKNKNKNKTKKKQICHLLSHLKSKLVIDVFKSSLLIFSDYETVKTVKPEYLYS